MATRLLAFPQFPSIENACDILNRIAWGLYGMGKDDVSLYVEEKAVDGSNVSNWLNGSRLSAAQENYLQAFSAVLQPSATLEPRLVDFGLFWDSVAYLNNQSLFSSENKILIDPNFHFNDEADKIAALQYTISSEERKKLIRETSQARFVEFLSRWEGIGSAYLYLTGPTVESVFQQAVNRNAIHIICNSIVKNAALLERIQPDVLMFSDPAYHFGVSKYAAAFRAYARKTMELFPNMLCMVPESYFPLTVAFLGAENIERIIGIPLVELEGFCFPSISEFHLRKTGNILTSMMVPVASSVAQKVHILGADGRASSDKGYWSHSKSSQMSDQLKSIYEAHPALGRDEDVEKYYQEHIQLLEAELVYGEEKQNREYICLTPSMIPALANRMPEP
jgi:hypothetical protein